MAYSSDDSYDTSESETGSLHSLTRAVIAPNTTDVIRFMKVELQERLQFDQSNVLARLGLHDVDNEIVQQSKKRLHTDPSFLESKDELVRLYAVSEEKFENELEDYDHDDQDDDGSWKRIEEQMMKLLNNIIDRICHLMVEIKNGQYNRRWVSTTAKNLRRKKDTGYKLPEKKPNFILCDEYKNVRFKTGKELEDIWRRRRSFVNLKPLARQGPKTRDEDAVREIVAEAAEYARVPLSRPFQLFSIGLLISGEQFCVAIFDRDGVQLSPIYGLWDNLDIFLRIIRRMCHEMTPVDFGQDPKVQILPHNDPISVACRRRAIALADVDGIIDNITSYPTYSIDFCGLTYHTIGLPVWTSISLLGRGTSVWRVTKSHSESIMTDPIFILKTAWRQSNRPSESAILQRVKGNHDGLVKYSQGSDVFFPSSDAFPPIKITTANLRNLNHNVEGDTIVLHRLIFETVGRPIWDFNSYLEFFLAIKAALNAHRFLADQGILHRDISAGNVLLSSDPEAPDSQKGFLTDLEFAQTDDATFETKNVIPVPSVGPITGTPLPPGAVLTGTAQFMALELVLSFSGNQHELPVHRVYHDVESFVWVVYYGILRRIGYGGRDLNGETIPEDLSIISRYAFQNLFGHVYPRSIARERYHGLFSPIAFVCREHLWPLPIQVFFEDIHNLLMFTIRRRKTTEIMYGWGTHEELLVVLDKVIAALRKPPPPQATQE